MPTTREALTCMVRASAWDGSAALVSTPLGRFRHLNEESEEDDMSLDGTAAGLCWSSAGILVMEDGLIYGRGIAGHGRRSNFGVATPTPSFASILICALAGIAATAALVIASSAETVAAAAGWTP